MDSNKQLVLDQAGKIQVIKNMPELEINLLIAKELGLSALPASKFGNSVAFKRQEKSGIAHCGMFDGQANYCESLNDSQKLAQKMNATLDFSERGAVVIVGAHSLFNENPSKAIAILFLALSNAEVDKWDTE